MIQNLRDNMSLDQKPNSEHIKLSLEILNLSLEALEVNPEQTAYFLGDILINEDLYSELSMTPIEIRQASFDWLTVSASFGNTKAHYEISMILREEICKIIFNSDFVWNGPKGISSILSLKELDSLWIKEKPILSESLQNIFQSSNNDSDLQNETQELLYSVYHNLKHKEISINLLYF